MKHIGYSNKDIYGVKNKVTRLSTSFRPSQVSMLERLSKQSDYYIAIIVRCCLDYAIDNLGEEGILRELNFYNDDAK